jgi:hypothetical protein
MEGRNPNCAPRQVLGWVSAKKTEIAGKNPAPPTVLVVAPAANCGLAILGEGFPALPGAPTETRTRRGAAGASFRFLQ